MPTNTKETPTTISPVTSSWGVKDILLAVLVVVVAILAYFLLYPWQQTLSSTTLAPDDLTQSFSGKAVVRTFEDGKDCNKCLTCLSKLDGNEEKTPCDTLTNVFQCVEQLTYLYGRPDANQPCYQDCHTCVEGLKETSFGELEKLEDTLWQVEYPELFRSPEAVGYEEYEVAYNEEAKEWEFTFPDTVGNSTDVCCGTINRPLPYTRSMTLQGKTWYPVWFYMQWPSNIRRYQWYQSVHCRDKCQACGPDVECELVNLESTYLMTTSVPSSVFGHTYNLLYVDHSKVKFFNIYKPAYCQCIH